MKNVCVASILYLIFLTNLYSQQDININLDEVIRVAQGEAPVSLIAQTRLQNNYWRYQSFLSGFKPQLTFEASSNLNRSFNSITLPDGKEAFVDRAFITTNSGIRLGQAIPSTGGFVFAGTSLERIDLFGNSATDATTSYLSAPFFIGFVQPIFQFNRNKWQQKVESLNYEESKKRYVEEKEQIAFDAVNFFFTLYIAQLNLEEARRQKIYADSLYEISIGRFEVGRIAETDLLQIELRSKNAEALQATQLLNYQTANEELRNFLGMSGSVVFDLQDPPNLENYEIDADLALQLAKRYRSLTTNFQRQLMEAEMDLDEAIKSGGAEVSLNGSFGLSQTAQDFRSAYRRPIDQERLSLSLNVPIADWGLTKARREIARSNLELTQRQIEQENINFEREVVLRVQQFDLKKEQLALSQRAFEVADKRVTIAKNRYQIGKIDVTELNIALNEYENSRQAYFQSLWALWTAHYEIRNLTLYDFIENKPLRVDADLENW